MPKSLAQGNRKLVWVPDGGLANVAAPKLTELSAAGVFDISCLVTKADYNLGPTGDTEITDPAFCAQGDSSVPGNTQYEGGMNFFRWSVTTEDKAWTTFTSKGIHGYLVERIGLVVGSYKTPFAIADQVRVFGAITGTPMMLAYPTDGGFEKFRQPFNVQSEEVNERAVLVA